MRHSTKADKMAKRGMFRVSKFMPREKDLALMVEHFKTLGIATEIRREGSGFALYREGEEAIYNKNEEYKKEARA